MRENFGPFVLEADTGRVYRDGTFIAQLTKREQAVLEVLLAAYPKPLLQEEVAERADIMSGNSGRQHVLRLRWKLHDHSVIEGIRQRGYRMNPEYM